LDTTNYRKCKSMLGIKSQLTNPPRKSNLCRLGKTYMVQHAI
jgi:hypothetical protein